VAKVNIDIAVNQADAQRKIQRLQSATTDARKGFDRLRVSVNNSTSAFKIFAGNVAAIGFSKLVSGVTSFAGASIDAIRQVEDLNTQFQVLTGSAAAANKAVADLTEFAAKTPFQLAELAEAQQRLLSFQFSLEESQELLGELGDVAAAANKPIGELALIFGQVSAAGKLTGERLLQLEERAIPIGPAIARTMGIAESAVRDAVSSGQVDFATFEKAFRSLNDTGEFAFEGMIKRSRTLSGRISTLKDNFFLLAASVGRDSNLGVALKALTTTLTVFIDRIQNSAAFKQFIEFIGSNIPAAIQFAVNSFSFIVNSVFNVIKVFNLFRSGVANAVSQVIKNLTILVDVYDKVFSALGLGDTVIGRGIKSIKSFRDQVTSSLEDTADSFAQKAAEIGLAQEQVNQAINEGSKFIQKTYQEEIVAAEELANATVESNEKKKQSIRELTEAETAALEKTKSLREEIKLLEEQNRLEDLNQTQIFQDEKLIRLQDFLTREEEIRIQARLNQTNSDIEKEAIITEAEKTAQENRLNQLRDAKKRAAEIVKEDNAQLVKLEQVKKQQVLDANARLFGGLAAIARSGGRKTLGIFKTLATAQAIMSTYAAINKTLADPSLFFPANVITAAAIGAQGFANVINIQQQGFEQGGIVPGTSFTGDNVTARVNSGEMILNRQQQSQLFEMANGRGQTLQQSTVVNQPIIIELDNEAVGRATSKWVANGGQLGEVQ
jgi:tape measure domain-containing protein